MFHMAFWPFAFSGMCWVCFFPLDNPHYLELWSYLNSKHDRAGELLYELQTKLLCSNDFLKDLTTCDIAISAGVISLPLRVAFLSPCQMPIGSQKLPNYREYLQANTSASNGRLIGQEKGSFCFLLVYWRSMD